MIILRNGSDGREYQFIQEQSMNRTDDAEEKGISYISYKMSAMDSVVDIESNSQSSILGT